MFSLYTGVSVPQSLREAGIIANKNLKDIRVYNKYEFDGADEEVVMSSLFLFRRGEVLRELTLNENETIITLPDRMKFKEKHLAEAIELFSGEKPEIYVRKVIVCPRDAVTAVIAEIEEANSSAKLYSTSAVEGFISMSDGEIGDFYNKYNYKSDIKNFISLRNYFKKEGRNPTFLELAVAQALWQENASDFNAHITDIETDTDLEQLEEIAAKCVELVSSHGGEMTLSNLAELPLKYLSEIGEIDDIRSMNGKYLMEERIVTSSGQEDWILPQEIATGTNSDMVGLSGEAFGNISAYGAESVFSIRAGFQPKDKANQNESKFCSFCNTIGANITSEIYSSNNDYISEHIFSVGAIGANIDFLQPKEGDYIVHVGDSITALEGGEAIDGEIMRRLKRFYAERASSGKLEKTVNIDKRGLAFACFAIAKSANYDFDKVPRTISCCVEELAFCLQPGHVISAVGKDSLAGFMDMCASHGLTPTVFGVVSGDGRFRIKVEGNTVCDFASSFLAGGGFRRETRAMVYGKAENFKYLNKELLKAFKKSAAAGAERAVETFYQKRQVRASFSADSNALALLPQGGKYQLTKSMTSGIWLRGGKSLAVSSYGSMDGVAQGSPFLSAVYSVLLAVNKLVASGVEPMNIKLALSASYPELNGYEATGNAAASVLGAVKAQLELGIPSLKNNFISGNPSFVCFSSGVLPSGALTSNVFTKGQRLFRIPLQGGENPDFKHLKKVYGVIIRNIEKKNIQAAAVVEGDIISTLINSLAGNGLGLAFAKITEELFVPTTGDFIVAVNDVSALSLLEPEYIGITDDTGILRGMGVDIPLSRENETKLSPNSFYIDGIRHAPKNKYAKPLVLIPSVAGTSSDYALQECFAEAGANTEIIRLAHGRKAFFEEFSKKLAEAQILALPAGSDLSSIFYAALLKSEEAVESLERFLTDGDGLILGLGSGFKALMDSGLLGEKGLTRLAKARCVNTSIAKVTVSSNLSMWSSELEVGRMFDVPLATAYGRFTADEDTLKKYFQRGQIAMQYCGEDGKPSLDPIHNPYESMGAAEAVTSRDGRIFGRAGNTVARYGSRNAETDFDLSIFRSGVKYFS